MPATAKSLTQLGMETTPGTAVPATHLLPSESKFNLKQTYDKPKEQRGSYDEFFGGNLQYLTRIVDWELKGQYLPETHLWLWLMGLTNNPTIVNTTASAPNPAYNTWTFLPSDTLKTATFEEYDGTSSWNYPYGFMDKVSVDFTPEKCLQFTATGMAKDKLPMGAANGNHVTVLTQPTDFGLNGIQGTVYIDPVGGAMGTTPNADLMSWKWDLTLSQKHIYTSNGSATFTRIYRGRRMQTCEFELDFTNIAEYNNFLSNNYRYFQIQLVGSPLGAGATKNEQLTISLPMRYEAFEIDKTKEHAACKVKGIPYYDTTLGYSCTVVAQVLAAGPY